MTKMFTTQTPKGAKRVRTWNFIVGCDFDCSYCVARDLALGRLKHTWPYNVVRFAPGIIEPRLKRRFRGGTIFPCFMGDMFGPWIFSEWIEKGIEAMRQSPNATFLLLTKNPWRYLQFLSSFPNNIILGATIESDIDHGVSKAPPPLQRAEAMAHISSHRKFVAIEPIMEFDMDSFVGLLERIKPDFVYCGYDNHNKHLIEPPLAKTLELIAALERFTEVRAKTIREAWSE